MNNPVQYKYYRIAGLHNSCVSVECYLDSPLNDTEMLLVVLGVFRIKK